MIRQHTKESVVAALREFHAEHRRPIRMRDCKKSSLPHHSIIWRLFGGLANACDAAGIPRNGGRLNDRMPWPAGYFGVKVGGTLPGQYEGQ